MTPLPDISDLVSRIKGLDGEILRLEMERKELAKERRLIVIGIINKYVMANVPYEKCDHPKEIMERNPIHSSFERCEYCGNSFEIK